MSGDSSRRRKRQRKTRNEVSAHNYQVEAMETDVSGRPPVSWEEKRGSQSLSECSVKKQHFSTIFKTRIYEGRDQEKALWKEK